MYLQADRAAQLEAVLALKVDESKDARKRTRLTDAKAITGEALLKLHLDKQAKPSKVHKHISFNRLPKSCPSTSTT